MELAKQKGLTHKEQAVVRNLAAGKNLTESGLAAGYSDRHPGQSGWQALKNIQLKMPQLLDRYGLTDHALIEKHLKPLLGATETTYCQYKGEIRDTVEVPALAIRLDALDMAFRLKGSYPPPGSENKTKKCVQVVVAPPLPKRSEDSLAPGLPGDSTSGSQTASRTVHK